MRSYLACLFLCFFIIEVESLQCTNGSSQFPREDICLYVVDTPQVFSDATRHCQSLGGQIVKLLNVYENAYVYSYAQGMSVSSYIGIVKNVANNTWTYTDGSALTYQNWASNEPKNTTGNTCTIIDTVTGKWVTTGCTTARPYFCSVAETASKCSSGWTYSQQTDYCYYVQNFTTPTDWKAAEKSCKKMGAHLVSIHSKTEEDFVYDLIASRVGKKSCDELWAWTGLYGTGATRSGSWTDGSPVDYPTDHETSSYYYWMMGNDASCNERRWDWIPSADRTYSRAVCKMEPTNVKQTNRQSIVRRILKA